MSQNNHETARQQVQLNEPDYVGRMFTIYREAIEQGDLTRAGYARGSVFLWCGDDRHSRRFDEIKLEIENGKSSN